MYFFKKIFLTLFIGFLNITLIIPALASGAGSNPKASSAHPSKKRKNTTDQGAGSAAGGGAAAADKEDGELSDDDDAPTASASASAAAAAAPTDDANAAPHPKKLKTSVADDDADVKKAVHAAHTDAAADGEISDDDDAPDASAAAAAAAPKKVRKGKTLAERRALNKEQEEASAAESEVWRRKRDARRAERQAAGVSGAAVTTLRLPAEVTVAGERYVQGQAGASGAISYWKDGVIDNYIGNDRQKKYRTYHFTVGERLDDKFPLHITDEDNGQHQYIYHIAADDLRPNNGDEWYQVAREFVDGLRDKGTF